MSRNYILTVLISVTVGSLFLSVSEASKLSKCFEKKCNGLEGTVKKRCRQKCTLQLTRVHTDCPLCSVRKKK